MGAAKSFDTIIRQVLSPEKARADSVIDVVVDIGYSVGDAHHLALQSGSTGGRFIIQIFAALTVGGDAVSYLPS